MRIYAISDLHTDFRANREALERVPMHAHRGDALIVAGDVADSEAVLRETLELLASRFAEVFFVPGNHELWVRGETRSSVDKFHAVLAVCDQAGVRTAPARAGGAWVVPLFSWYHPSFDVLNEAAHDELEGWADRYFCRWPAGWDRPHERFLDLNVPRVHGYDAPVVTFSHFVPRTELVPAVRHLRFKGLPLVAGTVAIDTQIRLLGARVHVFGHTHIAEDRVIEGVRYVQNYFRPEQASPFQLVWDDESPGPEQPLFC